MTRRRPSLPGSGFTGMTPLELILKDALEELLPHAEAAPELAKIKARAALAAASNRRTK